MQSLANVRGKLAAVDTKQDQNFPDRARKLAAENSDINGEGASKWPHNLRISRANVPHLEKVYSNLRQQLKREPEDKMEDLNVNTMIWGEFMMVNQQAAVHPGNVFARDLRSTRNQAQRTMKQSFDVTRKLVSDQTEIQGISLDRFTRKSLEKDDSVE